MYNSPHHRRPVYDASIFPTDHVHNDAESMEWNAKHILPIPGSRTKKHDSKRQRTQLSPSIHDENLGAVRRNNTHPDPRDVMVDIDNEAIVAEKKEKKVDLSPCHICRRKPTAKHELDAFADCEGCGQRTCWICIRGCLGMGDYSLGQPDLMAVERKWTADIKYEKRGIARELVGECKEDGQVRWDTKTGNVKGHRGRICSRCCVERGTEGEVWCLGCLRAEGDG